MRKLPCPYTDPEPLFRHGGSPWLPLVPELLSAAALADRPLLDFVVDFSANLNPFGPPAQVNLLARQWLSTRAQFRQTVRRAISHYPPFDCLGLRQILAACHHLDSAHFIVGNGSSEIIDLLARALLPKRVVIVEPTYTDYLRVSLLVGAKVSHWLAEGDTFELCPFDPEMADLVWLCNPNNPTSQLWPQGSLVPWIEAHPQTTFVMDEAFLPFRADQAQHSLVGAVAELSNLIVLRSLTKFYALAGLRIGYACAAPDLIARLQRLQIPWSVNTHAQMAAAGVLNAPGDFERHTLDWIRNEVPAFLQRLTACSSCLEVIPAQANFVLIRLKHGTSAWVKQRLQERGLLIRDASNFVGLDERYIRVAVRTAEENARLCAELHALFAEG